MRMKLFYVAMSSVSSVKFRVVYFSLQCVMMYDLHLLLLVTTCGKAVRQFKPIELEIFSLLAVDVVTSSVLEFWLLGFGFFF